MNPRLHGVSPRFDGATVESLHPEFFGDVLTYAGDAATYLKQGKGLILSGPPGIGKTWAVVGLMKAMAESIPRWDYQVITAPTFFDVLYDAKAVDEVRNQLYTVTFENVRGLVLNDLGKEDRSRDWFRDSVCYKLGRLLRHRSERLLPIYVTTNLTLTSGSTCVQQVYGESIWSLLYEMTAYRVQVVAPDRRRGGTA